MNRARVGVAAAGSVVVLLAGLPGQATAADPAGRRQADPAPCTGTFQGDVRLGPEHLASPSQQPFSSLLAGYSRTGSLSPEDFLRKYWQGSPETGGWKYPPDDGFDSVNGSLDKWASRLEKGEKLDRFGGETSRFLAPAGTGYAERAIPPQNLNTSDAAYPCNYYVYRVTRPLTVWQGSIAPWFEQKGGGQQMLLDAELMPPSERPAASDRLNVGWLVAHGYLTRLRAGG